MVSRRKYLTALAVGTLTLSGCSSIEDDDRETPDLDPSRDGSDGDVPTSTPTPSPDDGTDGDERGDVDGEGSSEDDRFDMLDIRDFGAAVDGETDDTDAVRAAIESASAGDTVFFPAGETLVSSDGVDDVAPIALLSGEIPDNLTLAGEGRESQIRLDERQQKYHKVIRVEVGSGVEGLRIRDLLIDGNKKKQSIRGGHGVRIADAKDEMVPASVSLRNLWIRNCNRSGIATRHYGLVVDRCTIENCAKHGISLGPNGGATDRREPIVVRNTLCRLNGKDGPAATYGINCSYGRLVVDNCVLENNAQGTKTTSRGVEIVYRRVRLDDNDENGYTRAGETTSERTRVVFDDVVSSNNGNTGFRLARDTDYFVPTEVLATQNDDDNVRITENAALEAETVWANRSQTYGISSSTSVGGLIKNYHPFDNLQGWFNGQKTLEILLRNSLDKTDIDGVPTREMVGAGGVTHSDVEGPL